MSDVGKSLGEKIRLKDAIAHLREEIRTAIIEGAGKQIRFRAKAIELEFTVGFTVSAEGTAGIKVWVIELGGKGSAEQSASHKVKLQLELADDGLIMDPDMAALGDEEDEGNSRPEVGGRSPPAVHRRRAER